MGWVSPTGFVDPDNKWSDEGKAYDDNIGTYATHADIGAYSWGSYLELTHAAIDCNKVQYRVDGTGMTQVSVDVYYDGDWHNIYEGTFTYPAWEEKSIPAGTKSVTAARLKIYNDTGVARVGEIYEFDFWEVPPAVGRSFGYIMG